jgi:chaperonin GroEL
MTAKLATVDDRILAGAEESCAVHDILPPSASSDSQVVGMQFGCGYLSPYFVTDPERMEVVLENAYILIHEKKLSSKNDLLPLLEQITKCGKSLLIIADDVEDEVLAALVVTKLRGLLQVAAVRAPSFGDQRKSMLQDIALFTCSNTITEGLDIQLKDIKLSDLGQAKKVVISKNSTRFEGTAKYDDLPIELEAGIRAIGHTQPVRSSGTEITARQTA